MFDALEKSFFPRSRLKLIKKMGPLFHSGRFKDIKDPCIVRDGSTWHIYGSGGNVRDERWNILHAVSPELSGPWNEIDPATLEGVSGDHVAAPGVVFDGEVFHMFVQTEFMTSNGTVEYLTSSDGSSFIRHSTVLASTPGTEEAGIYDPHPAEIKGEKYLVYSGSPRVHLSDGPAVLQSDMMRPDVFLARSETNSWAGPWKRVGKILDHETIKEHHNQHDNPQYEWGIEGPQLIELRDGTILLNATCFLPYGTFGTRQRVFFAVAESVEGPYRTLGPILSESFDEWESGENGHASGILIDDILYLFYQARSMKDSDAAANDWRYGIAAFHIGN